MDPNSNLAEQLVLAQRIADGCPDDCESNEDMRDWYENKASRLADLVFSLDEWMCKGGFLPASWEVARIKAESEKH